jgi:hypothetical protein
MHQLQTHLLQSIVFQKVVHTVSGSQKAVALLQCCYSAMRLQLRCLRSAHIAILKNCKSSAVTRHYDHLKLPERQRISSTDTAQQVQQSTAATGASTNVKRDAVVVR